ncbi:MAG: helix-turn-helix domain-containing protein [Candidatus Hydrogenedentota bacterium]
MTKEIVGLSPAALEKLVNYGWPGSVRELENSIERAFIVCHDTHIDERHLPNEVLSSQSATSPASISADHHYREIVVDREEIMETLEQTDWNIAKTARALGMARNTLYHKMKTRDIERPAKR